jgi:ribosomal protein S18 acetylase RimI-like enzyme
LIDALDFRFLETSNDFRQLEPFAASIWEQHYTPIIGADQVAFMLEKFQSAQAMFDQFSAGYKYAVVICGDQKAGYFAYDGKAEKEVFISKLYIHKDFRRRGLGRHILDFIAKETRALGCTAMTLSVNKDNSNSIQFYIAYGFQTIKAQKVAIGEGFYMDDYVMSYPVQR